VQRACSAINALPSTFGSQLPSLTTLDLTLCKGLTVLPDSIGLMHSLQTLFLGNCFNIAQLPETITRLKSLVTLNLYNCGGLKSLPDTFDELETLQVLSLQGCEKLIEVPESLSRCLTLSTLTLWNCQVLERLPDLSAIPGLQVDGVPEQLASWEAEQKEKRAQDAREGKNKGANQPAAAKNAGWAAMRGVGAARAATAASVNGAIKTREELANIPAAYEAGQAGRRASVTAPPDGGGRRASVAPQTAQA
jgi:hypothetical protein